MVTKTRSGSSLREQRLLTRFAPHPPPQRQAKHTGITARPGVAFAQEASSWNGGGGHPLRYSPLRPPRQRTARTFAENILLPVFPNALSSTI